MPCACHFNWHACLALLGRARRGACSSASPSSDALFAVVGENNAYCLHSYTVLLVVICGRFDASTSCTRAELEHVKRVSEHHIHEVQQEHKVNQSIPPERCFAVHRRVPIFKTNDTILINSRHASFLLKSFLSPTIPPGCLSFHPMAQCVVHALKGLACRARVTPARSPASHCKQCSALTSPAFHARGCVSPPRAR